MRIQHAAFAHRIPENLFLWEKKKTFRHCGIYTDCCLCGDSYHLIGTLTLSWPKITQHHLDVYAKKKKEAKSNVKKVKPGVVYSFTRTVSLLPTELNVIQSFESTLTGTALISYYRVNLSAGRKHWRHLHFTVRIT